MSKVLDINHIQLGLCDDIENVSQSSLFDKMFQLSMREKPSKFTSTQSFTMQV